MLEIAQEEAAGDGVESVHMNQWLSTITDGEVDSALRPDVAVAYENGTYDVIEIPSTSQTVEEMQDKVDGMVKLLGNLAGKNSRVEQIR
jgi:hypothetical protein